jgi:excisionase family DNA binding protein
MVSKPMEELLTLGEAAKVLKVHPNTLRLWDKKGVLIAIRIGVKKVRRYKREDIEKFINTKNK